MDSGHDSRLRCSTTQVRYVGVWRSKRQVCAAGEMREGGEEGR